MDNIIWYIIIIVLLVINGIVIILRSKKSDDVDSIKQVEEIIRSSLEAQRDSITKQLTEGSTAQFQQFATIQSSIQDTLGKNSVDTNTQLSNNRQELSQLLTNNRRESREQLDAFGDKVEQKLQHIQQNNADSITQLMGTLSTKTLELNNTLEEKIKTLQESNEKRLEQMQKIVDEKLQETLNQRINQSFEQVSTQLASVQQGLGEMQKLASDVGSLQRVMTGVKTRGISGEVQLGRILEDMFTHAQYREQVNIKDRNSVDFAVVLPGKSTGSEVLLPIDSKFPQEDYIRLTQAQDLGDKVAIDSARKALFAAIKAQAKSIHEKYIEPPITTDFAIMFLPTEGLFMEVVNDPELYEQLGRDYKVNITGPTTMTAVLNSLQMGFKTLQIEQKSSEVYALLGAVKTEFGKFETSLKKVHDRLQASEKEISALITTRTRAMHRKLRDVDEIDSISSSELLGLKEEEDIDQVIEVEDFLD